MKEIVLPFNAAVYRNAKSENASRRLWTIGAAASALGGFAGGFVGMVLIVLAVLEPLGYAAENRRAGGILMIAAIPLFLFAAHCLDKIEAARKAEKVKNYLCRKSGVYKN